MSSFPAYITQSGSACSSEEHIQKANGKKKEENSEDQEFEIWREYAKDTEAESLRQPSNRVNQSRRNQQLWRMPDVAVVILSAAGRKSVQAFPGRAPAVLKPLQENCRKKKIQGDEGTFHNCRRSSMAAKYGSRKSGSTFLMLEVRRTDEQKSMEGSKEHC